MSLNQTYSSWISHFVNQRDYLKNVIKSKLHCRFPHACWSLFDALKRRITQFDVSRWQRSSLNAGQQSLLIIVITFIHMIITSAFVKCKINRAGIESFQFPWSCSAHTSLVDVQLNSTMHLISGTLRSTPLPWLPVLSNIEPSALRRKATTDKLVEKIVKHDSWPIQPDILNPPLLQLTSRKPLWLDLQPVDIKSRWRHNWKSAQVVNSHLVCVTPQSDNQVLTSLSNSGLCWTVFTRNRDTAVPAEGNSDLQTLICVLVARPRRCSTLLNPVPWQNWIAAYLGYTLQMKTLFRG